MAKSSVQRALNFSVDRLGYESLKPEQVTVQVFLCGKNVFAALPIGYGKSLHYTCSPHAFQLLKPLQSIQTGLPAYINAFEQATRKQKLSISLFSVVMFTQEADQNRYQRSDSIATDLTPFSRVNDHSPTTTTSSGWRQIVVRQLVMRVVNYIPHILPLRPLQCPFTRPFFHFSLSTFPKGRGAEG